MTPEQQLKIRIFAQQNNHLSETETKQKLINMLEDLLKMDNHYKQVISQA